MDIFFYMSKFFWVFFEPAQFFFIFLCLGAVLLWSRWRRAGRWLITLLAVAALAVATLPIGVQLSLMLENRFPAVTEPPERIDGIITLGGILDQFVTKQRGQISFGGGADRLAQFSRLAQRYPDAKLVFTGGSGRALRQDVKEADYIKPVMDLLGVEADRIIVENQSRNTYENAVAAFNLVKPKPGETWILITSAFHMPRTVGCFRKVGWRVFPYPVDYRLQGDENWELGFSFITGLAQLSHALHEWVGLIAYRLMGKTDILFPGPEG